MPALMRWISSSDYQTLRFAVVALLNVCMDHGMTSTFIDDVATDSAQRDARKPLSRQGPSQSC